MAIVIKEIIVKSTINRNSSEAALSQEILRKLKREIVQEVIKTLEKKIEWEREW